MNNKCYIESHNINTDFTNRNKFMESITTHNIKLYVSYPMNYTDTYIENELICETDLKYCMEFEK